MGLYNNRIVVKVGTSTLTNDAGKSDLRATDRLVCTLADIHNMGSEVILVSSGATDSGRTRLRSQSQPDRRRHDQAHAPVDESHPNKLSLLPPAYAHKHVAQQPLHD